MVSYNNCLKLSTSVNVIFCKKCPTPFKSIKCFVTEQVFYHFKVRHDNINAGVKVSTN